MEKENVGYGKYITLVLVAIVLVLSITTAFQVRKIEISLSRNGLVAGDANSQSGNSETYEQMMARMHPDLASDEQAADSNAGGAGMVGGC